MTVNVGVKTTIEVVLIPVTGSAKTRHNSVF